MKSKLITSRNWHKPNIETFVTNDEIGSSMDLDDFLKALVEEVGNPTMLLTKTQLLAKLQTASEAIKFELRDSTRFIV